MAIRFSEGGERAMAMVARLPLLGPLVGWTRRDPDGKLRTRLWVKADDYDGQPAVMALTARWKDGKSSNVELWGICTADLDTQPPAQERFALADIEAEPNETGLIRMVTLHLRRGFKREGSVMEFVPPSTQQVESDDAPRVLKLQLTDLFQALGPEETAERLHQLAREFADDLFRDLERRLLGHRRPRLPGETRPRPKERSARIELCEVALRAERPDEASGLRFAAGCCRHPGMNFDRQCADRALDALAREAARERLELVLMLGDQIYADATAGVIDAEDRLEKYTSRYYEAFDSPGFRRLARRVPVYMAGDDHEIRDNWPKDSVPPGAPQDARELFRRSEKWARQLFVAHQRSHGPDQPAWAPNPGGTKLWYAFEAGGFSFFCFDTRFERQHDSERMMEPYQLDCFRKWLAMACSGPARDKPKFILSGSVLAPTEREFAGKPVYHRRADSWAGYPAERGDVLHEILALDAQNVVFISGDLHCGAVASLHYPGAASLRCYSIVAPPFYAPFPFANLPAGEVAPVEPIETTSKSGGPISVECRATAFDTGGFALLSVKPPPPPPANQLDWEIGVEFCADTWNGNGRVVTSLKQAATLAGGAVTPA